MAVPSGKVVVRTAIGADQGLGLRAVRIGCQPALAAAGRISTR